MIARNDNLKPRGLTPNMRYLQPHCCAANNEKVMLGKGDVHPPIRLTILSKIILFIQLNVNILFICSR